jgi:hypothetical protein
MCQIAQRAKLDAIESDWGFSEGPKICRSLPVQPGNSGYIVVPVIVAQLWRRSMLEKGGQAALDATLKALSPLSLGALLLTLAPLFGSQGEQITRQPAVIAMLTVPILIQV